MKIDPDRLSTLRKEKRLSRLQLAERAEISERTIQRLEKEPHQSQKTQEHTMNGLAKALGVKTGVLTGELPLPESDKTPVDNPERVQIGAQIAPKARLAYDLIKHRYGVNATEIINMAPLFFTLLAEKSLAWRHEKLKEVREKFNQLHQLDIHYSFMYSQHEADDMPRLEEKSIKEADLFGAHLDDDYFAYNPFAYYLRKLTDELAKPDIVDVDGSDLIFGSPPKFPDYNICRDELDRIANSASAAKICLETGYARISEIPEELMAKDAGEEREKWLKDKLLNIIKEISEEDERHILIQFLATSSGSDEMKKVLEDAEARRSKSEVEKEGDDE